MSSGRIHLISFLLFVNDFEWNKEALPGGNISSKYFLPWYVNTLSKLSYLVIWQSTPLSFREDLIEDPPEMLPTCEVTEFELMF